jgi:hypothetical protein
MEQKVKAQRTFGTFVGELSASLDEHRESLSEALVNRCDTVTLGNGWQSPVDRDRRFSTDIAP